MRILKYKLFE